MLAEGAFEYLFEEGIAAIEPDPPFTVSEWADEHRFLSSKASSEPGKWRTSRTPYLREIMDSLSTYSAIETVAFMKGVQIGASEGGFNFVGYTIHHSPGPIMYVLPTIAMAKKFSKTRIDPMISESPVLAEKIQPARTRDSGNTIEQKDFDGGALFMAGANSGSGLRGSPVSRLVLDEVDAYPASADDEGDPAMLAIKRTANFPRRKIFITSSPKLKLNSRIAKSFAEGDRRYYNVKCEKCGEAQPIVWAAIKWEPGHPESAAFVCQAADPDTGELCEHRHTEARKKFLLSEECGAAWVPTAVPVRPNIRSYHLSALYSPWFKWSECVSEFMSAKDDPALLQIFVNTVLGEPWEDTGGEKADPDTLMAKREVFSDCPAGAAVVTAGVDVQPDRLELEVVGWGRDEESWSVDYQVLVGDPSQQEVWDQLDDYLFKRWPHPAFENGMAIAATAVDTGGANTQDVYRFVKPREGRRIWGVKGYAGARAVWPKKPTRNNKGRINLFPIGVDSAKATIVKRLEKTGANVSGAGACHFPMERDKDYFDQMTAEVKKTRYVKGFKDVFWWKPDHARNEALDCRVYAFAALQGLVAAGFVLNREAAKVERILQDKRGDEPETPPAALPADEDVSQHRGIPAPKPSVKVNRKRRRVVGSPYM
ncbi:phage terminase large subunit family protein [Mesorhizobium sp.]|uniref:phage terminase large subunit family protein n=1 Tax=Mesorhizobium sp. TaxID=1871066 RepID=UPI00257DF308|nr:phage terminase large subunit family protein [Mesorhizobium sp.]